MVRGVHAFLGPSCPTWRFASRHTKAARPMQGAALWRLLDPPWSGTCASARGIGCQRAGACGSGRTISLPPVARRDQPRWMAMLLQARPAIHADPPQGRAGLDRRPTRPFAMRCTIVPAAAFAGAASVACFRVFPTALPRPRQRARGRAWSARNRAGKYFSHEDTKDTKTVQGCGGAAITSRVSRRSRMPAALHDLFVSSCD